MILKWWRERRDEQRSIRKAESLCREHVNALARQLVRQGIPEDESVGMAEDLMWLGVQRMARIHAMRN